MCLVNDDYSQWLLVIENTLWQLRFNGTLFNYITLVGLLN